METKIKKWGNSLAIRIPKILAEEIAIYDESAVDLAVVEGRLLITPLDPGKVTLSALLDQVTDENLHRETATGPAVGDEAW